MKAYHLKDIIDEDILQDIQDRFAEATGFSAVTSDYSGKPITHYSNFSQFCKLVRKDSKCLQVCHQSDAHGGIEAARRGTPYIYRCHAGLVDFAIPIIVNGQYLGSMLAGQVKVEEKQTEKIDNIMKQTTELFDNKEIREAYEKVPVVSYERIVAGAQLMFTVANYIVEKDMLNLMQEELTNNTIKLMQEIKARAGLERALKDTEIKALQSQVNPHFMFNVLNTLGSLALVEKAEKTQELIYILAELLRYTVKNVNQMVRIEEEISQIERYMKIQAIRFGSKINYIIDISNDIMDFSVPSMILQPFVENAVIHGIELKEGNGFIKVLGYTVEDDIIFEISDDGIGMSKQKLIEVMDLDTKYVTGSKSTGIGISNANKRLIYTYGEEYKVNLKSKPGVGTTVFIKIPRDNSMKEQN